MSRLLSVLIASLLAASCEVKPQPISFGHDACHFCRMTIVDRQHAAEIVTVKGKVFKYDAIECMMNHLSKWKEPEPKFLLVTDYANPGELVDARSASYLISEAIPSPMGEFLTAFENEKSRNGVAADSGGEVLNWESLQEKFNISTTY